LVLMALWICGVTQTTGAESRVIKVLPHLMDEKGRISVSPGLFDRDAYQQTLRQNPSRISGIRFDVQWKAPRVQRDLLTIRLELRTARGEPGQITLIKAPTRQNRRWGGWSSVILSGEEYARVGEVLAWRAVLWDGSAEVAELKSFLW
jgi:hypothetical protein